MTTLKDAVRRSDDGTHFVLDRGVERPVRIFMNDALLRECEEDVFRQLRAATAYPGVIDVVLTPDAHSGYVVPVGCVIATRGTLCQAPVGYDIGCGMAALISDVPAEKGLDTRNRREFSELVMERVGMGVGRGSTFRPDASRFQQIIREGALALGESRQACERDYIPVDDAWDPPPAPVARGMGQLGSLGGGNHFIELQHTQEGKLAVMIHTGSRGFGHGLASHFIQQASRSRKRAAKSRDRGRDRDASLVSNSAEGVYFEPDDAGWSDYKNAVAAGANYAIVNRLLILEQVSRAFRKAFGQHPEMLYEISHNLVQEEPLPDGRVGWVHRKGATRAWPAGHPSLVGTRWETTGHPVIIPGSMGTTSFVLFPEPGAAQSLYSVNHGCGRRMSRSAAKSSFTQAGVNKQMKELGVLVNAGGDVPIDESPGCYKDPSLVIDAVVSAGLARVAYELTPIASLKGVD